MRFFFLLRIFVNIQSAKCINFNFQHLLKIILSLKKIISYSFYSNSNFNPDSNSNSNSLENKFSEFLDCTALKVPSKHICSRG